MKKHLVLFALLFSFFSCSVDDNSPGNFYFEILPVESVVMPEQFQAGQSHEIEITYLRPSGCHIFNDFYYKAQGNERTVAVINTVYTDFDCESFEDEYVQVSFNFRPINSGIYIFKFWEGEDEQGNDQYYIVEVPVEN